MANDHTIEDVKSKMKDLSIKKADPEPVDAIKMIDTCTSNLD